MSMSMSTGGSPPRSPSTSLPTTPIVKEGLLYKRGNVWSARWVL